MLAASASHRVRMLVDDGGTVGVWVGGSIVTIVLAAKPLYCSLGLVCDPLVQKLVFRALLGL